MSGSYPPVGGHRFESRACFASRDAERIRLGILFPQPDKPSTICQRVYVLIMDCFTVYCLYSNAHDKIYIGYTSDLIQRFYSHNFLAKKGYTLKYRPWIVAYTEVFHTKATARTREKQLKSAQGRMFLRNYISINNLSVVSD